MKAASAVLQTKERAWEYRVDSSYQKQESERQVVMCPLAPEESHSFPAERLREGDSPGEAEEERALESDQDDLLHSPLNSRAKLDLI
tara:strand:- start:687 stop:947 length:261 start_codon:yes stop_codon:yes gene_type:complete